MICVSDVEWTDLLDAFKDVAANPPAYDYYSNSGERCHLSSEEVTARIAGPWKTLPNRLAELTAIAAFLAAMLAVTTYDDLVRRAASGQVVWGKCLTPDEVLEDPQVLHSKLLSVTKHELGEVRLPRPSAQFSATPTVPRKMAPSLDQHGVQVRRDGFTGLDASANDF